MSYRMVMVKRSLGRVLAVLLVIAATTITGCVSDSPVTVDGRIVNINELAKRLSDRYSNNLSKVSKSRPEAKWHGHYGSFAMTLFNIRASSSDVPEMIGSFRDYCGFIGGTHKVVSGGYDNTRNFSVSCEPRLPAYASDPAYYLFFVNVLLTPLTQPDNTANTLAYKRGDFTRPDKGGYARSNVEAYTSLDADGYSRVFADPYKERRTDYPRGYADTYTSRGADRYASGYGSDYTDAYSDAYKNTYRNSFGGSYKGAYRGARADTHYKGAHEEYHRREGAGAGAKANSGVFCVRFLASENLTNNTAFSDMKHYKEYRKRFIAVLKETKTYC